MRDTYNKRLYLSFSFVLAYHGLCVTVKLSRYSHIIRVSIHDNVICDLRVRGIKLDKERTKGLLDR